MLNEIESINYFKYFVYARNVRWCIFMYIQDKLEQVWLKEKKYHAIVGCNKLSDREKAEIISISSCVCDLVRIYMKKRKRFCEEKKNFPTILFFRLSVYLFALLASLFMHCSVVSCVFLCCSGIFSGFLSYKMRCCTDDQQILTEVAVSRNLYKIFLRAPSIDIFRGNWWKNFLWVPYMKHF